MVCKWLKLDSWILFLLDIIEDIKDILGYLQFNVIIFFQNIFSNFFIMCVVVYVMICKYFVVFGVVLIGSKIGYEKFFVINGDVLNFDCKVIYEN